MTQRTKPGVAAAPKKIDRRSVAPTLSNPVNEEEHVMPAEGPACQPTFDGRPYVNLLVHTLKDPTRPRRLCALLDSGATRSYLGAQGYEMFSPEEITRYEGKKPTVILANGAEEQVYGEVTLIVELAGQAVPLDFKISTALQYDAILGVDALQRFCMSIEFDRRGWRIYHLGSPQHPPTQPDARPEPGLCGLSDAQPEQKRILRNILEEFVKPGDGARLGLTNAAVH